MSPTDEISPMEDPAAEETVKNAVETLDDIISKVEEKYSEDQELLDNLENLKSLIGEESEDALNENKATDALKDMLKKLKDKISDEFKGMEDKEGMSETALMDLLNKLEGEMRGKESEAGLNEAHGLSKSDLEKLED